MECKTLLMELLHGKQIKKTMLDKCVLLLLYYCLLLGDAVIAFTPITYPAQIVSSQCSKHNSSLMNNWWKPSTKSKSENIFLNTTLPV